MEVSWWDTKVRTHPHDWVVFTCSLNVSKAVGAPTRVQPTGHLLLVSAGYLLTC